MKVISKEMSFGLDERVQLAVCFYLRNIGAILGTDDGDNGAGNVPPGESFEGDLVGSFIGAIVGLLLGARVGAFVGATYRYISNCAFMRST